MYLNADFEVIPNKPYMEQQLVKLMMGEVATSETSLNNNSEANGRHKTILM